MNKLFVFSKKEDVPNELLTAFRNYDTNKRGKEYLIVKNFNHYYDRKQGRLSQIVAEIFNTFVAFNHCYSYRRGAIFIGGQTDKDVHRL